MSSLTKDEVKYHMLRSQLDKIKYLFPLDYGSLDLVEALLNEILSLRRKVQSMDQDINDLKEKNETLVLGITAYKHQNKDLFKQNSDLHKEIINLLEKQSFKGKEIEFKRLNDDTQTLKFLLNSQKEKNQKIQSEIVQIKQKYIELVVDMYEKKVNMEKIFSELKDTEGLSLKPRGVEPYNEERSTSSNLNSMNSTNKFGAFNADVRNSTSNNNFSVSPMNTRTKNNSKQMIERIFILENEVKEKNKEIALLKKNAFNENVLDQKVVIDYLKKELKTTKEKYECIIKNQNEKIRNGPSNYYVKKPKQKPKEKEKEVPENEKRKSLGKPRKGKELDDFEKIKLMKKNASSLQLKNSEKELSLCKNKIEVLLKENEMLKKNIAEVVEKYNNSENYIQNVLEKEFACFSGRNENAQGADINLLTSLSQKIKETEANLNSSQQNYKNSMNELIKVNDSLKGENENLKKNIANNNKKNTELKERINLLNKRIFQLTAEKQASLESIKE